MNEIIRTLASLRADYVLGVPETEAIQCVLIVRDYDPAEKGGICVFKGKHEIIASALEKGLGISPQACRLLSAKDYQSQKFDCSIPRLIISSETAVLVDSSFKGTGPGFVTLADGAKAYITSSIEGLQSNVEIKRQFWNELKEFARILGSVS